MPDVKTDAFARMASSLKSAGVGHIDLLGGEPTLHPDIEKLVDTIYTGGMRTTVSSNGSRVDRLRALSDAYPASSVTIGISVNDTPISRALNDYILDQRPILKSVFYPDAPIPPAAAPYIGMDRITWYLIYRDLADRSDIADRVAFPIFFHHMMQLKKNRNGIDGVFCSGFIPDVQTCPSLASRRCPAGTTKLSVLPNGDVYPCYLFFRYPAFRLGNLLTDNFDHIRRHPALGFFQSFEKNRCPDHDLQPARALPWRMPGHELSVLRGPCCTGSPMHRALNVKETANSKANRPQES